MYYIIRWNIDFTRVREFVQDERLYAIAFETKKEAREYMKGHELEPLLEVIEI